MKILRAAKRTKSSTDWHNYNIPLLQLKVREISGWSDDQAHDAVQEQA